MNEIVEESIDRVNLEFIKKYNLKKENEHNINTNFIFNSNTTGEIFFIKNIFKKDSINEIIQKSSLTFFYYDKVKDFLDFLGKENIIEILKEKCVFFLFSKLDMEYIFYELNTHFPHHYINVEEELITYIETLKIKKIMQMKEKITDYYKKKDLKKMQENAKILLYNSIKFSRNLEKQWEEALKETDFIVEKINDINIYLKRYYNEYEFLYAISNCKPDIMIAIETIQNQFEFYTPEKLVFVSWIDWPSKILGDEKRYIEHLRRYNILIVPFITVENCFRYNCQTIKKYRTNVVKLIFSTQKNIIYFKRNSIIDIEKYGSDITMVGGANPENWLDSLMDNIYFNNIKNEYGIKLSEFYNKVKIKLKNDYLKENKFIEEKEYYTSILKENCFLLGDLYCEERDSAYLVYWLMFVAGACIYRDLVTEWILEKDYNIRFWGDNWKKHKLVKEKAFPSVDYEELAKVYSNSKITLCTTPAHSIHPRFFEAILCDCMCLISKTNKYDLASINTIFKEKESVDFFSSKNDLYEKIDYYLAYEKERKKIVKNAQQIIFEKEIYMEKILKDTMKQILDNIKDISNIEH